MEPINTLSNITYDIFHEICSYLPDDDFIRLRIVSKTISSKLAPSRVEEICSRCTVHYLPKDILTLKLLAFCSLKIRAKVKHIIYDTSFPYVQLIDRTSFDETIKNYPESTRLKLFQFCKKHWANGPWKRSTKLHKFQDSILKVTDRFRYLPRALRSSDGSPNAEGERISNQPENSSQGRLDPQPQSDVLHTASISSQLFSILRFYDLGREEPPNVYSSDFSYDCFSKAFITALKALPNLEIIETRYKSRRDTARETLTSEWRRYNHHIKRLLTNHPELESEYLPWHDWFTWREKNGSTCFERPDINGYGGSSSQYLMNYAVTAGCRITEIRYNITYISPFLDGIDTWRFWADLKNQHEAFANLTRAEISIAPQPSRRPYPYNEVRICDVSDCVTSVIFLDVVLSKVQDLTIRRPVYWGRLQHHTPHMFVPQNTALPKLRRLKIIESAFRIDPLIHFLKVNKSSLKELVCTATFSEATQNPRIIKLLEIVKADLNLEYYKIDFMTYDNGVEQCYLCVDVAVRESRYRVGTRCGLQSSGYLQREDKHPWRVISIIPTEERIAMAKKYWTERNSWEDFISGIREMEAPKSCGYHWDGIVTQVDPDDREN